MTDAWAIRTRSQSGHLRCWIHLQCLNASRALPPGFWRFSVWTDDAIKVSLKWKTYLVEMAPLASFDHVVNNIIYQSSKSLLHYGSEHILSTDRRIDIQVSWDARIPWYNDTLTSQLMRDRHWWWVEDAITGFTNMTRAFILCLCELDYSIHCVYINCTVHPSVFVQFNVSMMYNRFIFLPTAALGDFIWIKLTPRGEIRDSVLFNALLFVFNPWHKLFAPFELCANNDEVPSEEFCGYWNIRFEDCCCCCCSCRSAFKSLNDPVFTNGARLIEEIGTDCDCKPSGETWGWGLLGWLQIFRKCNWFKFRSAISTFSTYFEQQRSVVCCMNGSWDCPLESVLFSCHEHGKDDEVFAHLLKTFFIFIAATFSYIFLIWFEASFCFWGACLSCFFEKMIIRNVPDTIIVSFFLCTERASQLKVNLERRDKAAGTNGALVLWSVRT